GDVAISSRSGCCNYRGEITTSRMGGIRDDQKRTACVSPVLSNQTLQFLIPIRNDPGEHHAQLVRFQVAVLDFAYAACQFLVVQHLAQPALEVAPPEVIVERPGRNGLQRIPKFPQVCCRVRAAASALTKVETL